MATLPAHQYARAHRRAEDEKRRRAFTLAAQRRADEGRDRLLLEPSYGPLITLHARTRIDALGAPELRPQVLAHFSRIAARHDALARTLPLGAEEALALLERDYPVYYQAFDAVILQDQTLAGLARRWGCSASLVAYRRNRALVLLRAWTTPPKDIPCSPTTAPSSISPAAGAPSSLVLRSGGRA